MCLRTIVIGGREDELFVNYTKLGQCDHLAFIYMLDKQQDFPLNIANDAAPDHTATEDGVRKKSVTRKRSAVSVLAATAKHLGDQVNTIVKDSIKKWLILWHDSGIYSDLLIRIEGKKQYGCDDSRSS